MPVRFEREVAGKSRFRWDKPKRRAEIFYRQVDTYICTWCAVGLFMGSVLQAYYRFSLAVRVSAGCTFPTVHGRNLFSRAKEKIAAGRVIKSHDGKAGGRGENL